MGDLLSTFKPSSSNAIPTRSDRASVPVAALKSELRAVLTDEMRRICNNAIKIDSKTYPIIRPIRGTLAHKFILFNKENDEIILYLKQVKLSDGTNLIHGAVNKIVDYYETLDEYSKMRHDLFDHLAAKFRVSGYKFWGWIAEGIARISDEEVESLLLSSRTPLIQKVNEMAMTDGGHKDRDLLARITGIVKPAALVNINQNNNTVNVNSLPKFHEDSKRIEQEIEASKVAPRELSEGTKNYIEAEIEEVREECLIEKN